MEGKNFTELRIVFMGTPAFAVASLDALVKAGCNIVGVVTAPDKPGGRGMMLQQSAVKQYAVAHDLKVLQPEKLKNTDFINELRSLEADLHIVVAFRMLPEVVWDMPKMGSVNLHGSLLPQYRGAAPINWAVINGEKETGVTTFKLQHEIDTGDILLQESFPIADDDNVSIVHDRMMELGAAVLVKTVKGLADGSIQEKPQIFAENASGESLKHAPKIFTETCEINFNQTTEAVYNFIRGLSPYPAAFTFLHGKKLKIYTAQKIIGNTFSSPGTLHSDEKTFLHFACTDGYIAVLDLQLEGKKRMPVADFLRGYRFPDSKQS